MRPTWQKLAIAQQLQTRYLDSGKFQHLVLEKKAIGGHLRVFVEGDGTPWLGNMRVAVDPTPTNPVLLRLMGDSPGASVYLGRPCYFGLSADKGCESRFWTFDRYGREVVESMCIVVNRIASEQDAKSVQLIGYSGGGAIVVGMRTCTDRLVAITTIAANLDPRAWAEYHQYSPLHDLTPLKPAVLHPDPTSETHWQCADDRNVPPQVTDSYFAARKNAVRRIVRSCSHAGGWQPHWPEISGHVAGN